jgi:CDP-glucose 4,6-dehydratase
MLMSLGKSLKKLAGPVLITGHTGFKGTWATLLMESIGLEVVGFSLEPEKESLYTKLNRKSSIPEIFGDIRNFDSINKTIKYFNPSIVFHFAAEPLVLKSFLNPRLTFETNTLGTVNLVDSAFNNKGTKVITVITSDKVYRNDNKGKSFNEGDDLFGKDPYSASKVGAELAVSTWQNIRNIDGGPTIIAVRAGNVIGGGDTAENRLIPDLISSLFKSEKLIIKNPNSTRPWQHVLDPLVGYLMATEKAINRHDLENFNFGPSDSSLSVDKVVKISVDAWDPKSQIEIIYNEPKVNLESINLSLDSNKAKTILNWTPIWNQKEAIVLTIDWWKKYLLGNISPLDCTLSDIELAFTILRNRN